MVKGNTRFTTALNFREAVEQIQTVGFEKFGFTLREVESWHQAIKLVDSIKRQPAKDSLGLRHWIAPNGVDDETEIKIQLTSQLTVLDLEAGLEPEVGLSPYMDWHDGPQVAGDRLYRTIRYRMFPFRSRGVGIRAGSCCTLCGSTKVKTNLSVWTQSTAHTEALFSLFTLVWGFPPDPEDDRGMIHLFACDEHTANQNLLLLHNLSRMAHSTVTEGMLVLVGKYEHPNPGEGLFSL